MLRMTESTVLDAPPEAVWELIREFNGHDRWHPAVESSTIERGWDDDRIGCIRKFRLSDGSELREQLLGLSDIEQTYSYCLLETPIPLFNFWAEHRLLPVTDGDRAFWQWQCRFGTIPGREDEMADFVRKDLVLAGFSAVASQIEGTGS